MAELVGTRALARLLGMSPAAVTKAGKEGRLTPTEIVDGRPMFDPEEARKEWRPDVVPPSAESDDDDANTDDNARFRKARADKTEAEAAQEGLMLAKMETSLLSRDELILSFTSYLRVAGQAFSGLPAKLLSRFPGLTPAGRDFLITEMRTILDDLARWRPDA